LPRHLVTSAPSPADGIEHLSSLAESMLPADVYSRFLRARGEEVLFVCASDEHRAGVHLAQVDLAEWFGISFDAYGCSSSQRNRQQTEYFAKRLEEEGYIEPRSVRRIRDGRHLFLLRSKLAGELRSWLQSKSQWPEPVRSAGLEALDAGIGDFSITRDRPWGVPVERSGFEGMGYGAGFDGLIAYIGATREWADALGEPDAWRRWWCGTEDVRCVQFLAMSEVETHLITFPSMLIGSREAWKLADFMKAFNRLSYYDDRFPADAGAGVDAGQLAGLLAPDCWRYYLFTAAPEEADSSFSWEGLAAAVNEDLVDGFGRLVERSLELARRCCGNRAPSGGGAGPEEALLAAEVDAQLDAMGNRLEALEFRPALAELRAAWASGNAYLDRKGLEGSSEPDPEAAALSARTCLSLVAVLARASAPLIPFACEQVLDALAVAAEDRGWPLGFEPEALPTGHRFAAPPPLFPRIEAEDVELWRSRFGAPAVGAEAGSVVWAAPAGGDDGEG
jgi:methionyl-tRNA synthetase